MSRHEMPEQLKKKIKYPTPNYKSPKLKKNSKSKVLVFFWNVTKN